MLFVIAFVLVMVKYDEWDLPYFDSETTGFVYKEQVTFVYMVDDITASVSFIWKRDDILDFDEFGFDHENEEPFSGKWMYASNLVSRLCKRQMVSAIVNFMMVCGIKILRYTEAEIESQRWIHELRNFRDIMELVEEKYHRISRIIITFCDKAYRRERKNIACNLIATCWRGQMASPYSKIGRRRLVREYQDLAGGLSDIEMDRLICTLTKR